LSTLKADELEQLKDYMSEYDEVGVSTQTIFNLIAVWGYLNEIGELCSQV